MIEIVMVCKRCGHDARYHRVWTNPDCPNNCELCQAVAAAAVAA